MIVFFYIMICWLVYSVIKKASEKLGLWKPSWKWPLMAAAVFWPMWPELAPFVVAIWIFRQITFSQRRLEKS